MTVDKADRRRVLMGLWTGTMEDTEAALDALENGPTGMESFRAHALLLRDEGATYVSVGGMSVHFCPRPGRPG